MATSPAASVKDEGDTKGEENVRVNVISLEANILNMRGDSCGERVSIELACKGEHANNTNFRQEEEEDEEEAGNINAASR